MNVLSNIFRGARWGLAFATVYCAYVTLIFIIGGPGVLDRYGVSLGEVVLVYVVGGILSGASVGLLLPLTRWKAGSALVGVVAMLPVFVGIAYTVAGPPPWEFPQKFATVLSSVVVGGLGGLIFKDVFDQGSG